MSSNLFTKLMAGLGILTAAPGRATVNVVVSTYDGIVVAADSRVTLTAADNTRTLSDFGEKVKRVGSHAVVMFSGAAHIYDTEADLRNIGSIVDQYKNGNSISDSTFVDPLSVSKGLDSLFVGMYNKHQKVNCDRGLLWLVICGYDSTSERRIYQLIYPKKQASTSAGHQYDIVGHLDSTFANGVPTAFVRGQDDVWARLILGHDPRLDDHEWFREVDSIVRDSLDSTAVDTIQTRVRLDQKEYNYDIRVGTMTLQDAIDFAVFIVRATIEAQRFNLSSVQGVGGAIDIAVITPDGFQWIQHKRLHGERSTELPER